MTGVRLSDGSAVEYGFDALDRRQMVFAYDEAAKRSTVYGMKPLADLPYGDVLFARSFSPSEEVFDGRELAICGSYGVVGPR